ncbi:MAG TPA: alpha-amylase family glycosyl hydrolase [Kofleriaceae bacterium]
MRHPDVPEHLRGTYAGLAHPAVIKHLKSLGVTAVELLPIHAFIHDGFLLDKGLRNYWGYHSIGYFAPHPEYASVHSATGAVAEVKHMIRTLHQHGIEVILDVVYNHTARATTRARTCRCAASTTSPTTAPSPTTCPSTWTTPAPATRCRCAARTRCSS